MFPDVNLGLSGGHGTREYHVEFSRRYNDWAFPHFATHAERFCPSSPINSGKSQSE